MKQQMYYSKNGYELTQGFEAFRSRAYLDAGGKPTIAWGHTRGVALGLTCTREQGDVWQHEDVGYAEAAVNHLVTVDLTQCEFDALVDFDFNTGGLPGSTMLRLLNAGDYHGAALEFDKWDHVKGREVAGLLRRRQTEAALFESNGAD
jgi:lysozyme